MSAEERAKALFFDALDCFDAGDFVGAERQLCEVLTLVPERGSVLRNLAGAIMQQGRPAEAVAFAERAVALDGEDADALVMLVSAELALGRFDAALATFDRLARLVPSDAETWAGRGNVLAQLARWADALSSYDRALALQPDYAEVLCNRGNVLKQLDRKSEALASYDRALALNPGHVEALINRGLTLQELDRFEEALSSYDRALSLAPDHADALSNRGVALQKLTRHSEALESFDRALAARPDYAAALCNRGVTLKDLDRLEDALASLDRALALQPDYVEAIYNRGSVLKDLKRLDEALAAQDRVLALRPDHRHAYSAAAECVLGLCDWTRRAELSPGVTERALRGGSIIDPFVLLGYADDPATELACARRFFASVVPVVPPPLWTGARWRNDRVKIAYFSADFRSHPVAQLTAGLYEAHDRERFEVIAVSCGPDDGSEMRARIAATVDEFHDVRTMSDRAVARLMNDLQVDIVVDLSGYTGDGRSAVLAHRPAPIQVSYLGFSATMGTSLIDYIIADPVLLPFALQEHFAEKIVHLPDSYQVNDSRQAISNVAWTRADAGLPETGFVFCCFNNNWKLAPGTFDVWMRLMHAVPGSVLWLSSMNQNAMRNIRREAEARGIAGERVIFARRLDRLEDHLARHRLADLFLDTLPYNAHTTTSDALRAGLPVVTCMGRGYAARVAASLLTAVGLPELITTSLEDYEKLALDLAANPQRLAGLRTALTVGRDTGPLYDTARFTRHLEAAYTTMWELWQRGEARKSFSVAPLDSPVS